MIRGYTAEQVRAAEAPHLAAGEPLMQRAAHALAGRILALLEASGASASPRVLLLVGSGDNGGDALFAGAEVARADVEVDAIGVGSRMHETGRADAASAGVRFLEADAAVAALGAAAGDHGTDDDVIDYDVIDYDVIVDGILGTGTSAGSPALRGTARDVVLAIRAARPDRAAVVAVDIPSGVDPDTGAVADDAVLPADVTVTFGGIKAGLLRGEGSRLAGRVELVEIGIEAELAAMPPGVVLP